MPLTSQAEAFLKAASEENLPGWEAISPLAGRKRFQSYLHSFGDGPDLASIQDHVLPGGVRIRMFRSNRSKRAPAVIYFHGGGWVLGNLQTHDALCRRIAKQSDCTVVAVDYSLSPEAPFPTALHECHEVTKHLVAHADEWGIHADRIAVAGDSAGGNLAATVALKARNEGAPPIRLQLLIYPVIEPNFDSDSYQRFARGYGLTLANMRWFWKQYLGHQHPTELAAPSMADSLDGLPAAHVITAEYDVLRDEGEAYAAKLQRAGIPTTIRRYKGNLHGFIQRANVFDDARSATADLAQVIRDHLQES